MRASLRPRHSLRTPSAVRFPEGRPQVCAPAQRTEEPREGAPVQACVVPVTGDFGVPCKHRGWPSLPPGQAAGQVVAGKTQEGGVPSLPGGMWRAWQGADSASASGTTSALLGALHVTTQAPPARPGSFPTGQVWAT